MLAIGPICFSYLLSYVCGGVQTQWLTISQLTHSLYTQVRTVGTNTLTHQEQIRTNGTHTEDTAATEAWQPGVKRSGPMRP